MFYKIDLQILITTRHIKLHHVCCTNLRIPRHSSLCERPCLSNVNGRILQIPSLSCCPGLDLLVAQVFDHPSQQEADDADHQQDDHRRHRPHQHPVLHVLWIRLADHTFPLFGAVGKQRATLLLSDDQLIKMNNVSSE